jgi:hypothetical protein
MGFYQEERHGRTWGQQAFSLIRTESLNGLQTKDDVGR